MNNNFILPIRYIDGHKILPTHITCSELGMTTVNTENNTPYENANLLIKGLLDYGTILVDGHYQLDIRANLINANSRLTHHKIELIGCTQDATLEFIYGSANTYLFNFMQF
jgi:hypothetical protein